MTKILTSDQLIDIYTKQVRLQRFLIDHPELHQYQLDLENDLAGLDPVQKCIVLTTKMRENQLSIYDSFADIKELSAELISKVEALKGVLDNGGSKNTN